jgi:REP element-mobilizing transposase RayT
MNDRPQRKTDSLLVGRVSIPGARYFITICTKDKVSSLLKGSTETPRSILKAWRQLHADEDIHFYCGTVIPNHIHLLFKLGTRLELSQVIIKFKKLTKQALQKIDLHWQRNYYDHRLRGDTALEGFAKYTFLNPYRKELISVDQTYLHWHINKTYRPEFTEHLNQQGGPPLQWLNQHESIESLIEADILPNVAGGTSDHPYNTRRGSHL